MEMRRRCRAIARDEARCQQVPPEPSRNLGFRKKMSVSRLQADPTQPHSEPRLAPGIPNDRVGLERCAHQAQLRARTRRRGAVAPDEAETAMGRLSSPTRDRSHAGGARYSSAAGGSSSMAHCRPRRGAWKPATAESRSAGSSRASAWGRGSRCRRGSRWRWHELRPERKSSAAVCGRLAG